MKSIEWSRRFWSSSRRALEVSLGRGSGIAVTRSGRLRLGILALVVGAHLVGALWLSPAGYLGIDEVTYDLMLENLAAGRGLEVWNGYDELPSPELLIASLSAPQGRLVAQPPPFYSFLELPFYLLLGWRGAFIVSALAFAGVLSCTWLLGRDLYGERVAWNGTLILAVATFLPGYAQAGWPHALSTLLIVSSVLSLVGFGEARPLRRAALAGALCSLATGVRLDGIFLLPALLFIALLQRPVGWKRPAALLAGTLPGLAVLAWLNHLRFGSWSPFSYGLEAGRMVGGVGEYLPLAFLGLAVLAVLWVVASRSAAGDSRVVTWIGAAVLLVGVVSIPSWRALVLSGAKGLVQLLVDLRFRSLQITESVQERTASGAIVYLGAFKRSLLQSCPYLTVAAAGLCASWRRRSRALWVVLLPVLCYVGVYSAFAWHGGLAINLRYWTPTLPFLSLLVAFSLDEVRPALRWARAGVAAGAVGVPLAVFLVLDPSLSLAEPVLLTLPLVLAGSLLVLSIWWCSADGRRGSGLARGIGWITSAALAWAVVVAHVYELPWAAHARRAAVEARETVIELVPPDSLLITPFVVALRSVAKDRHVRIADPTRDGYADFRRLAVHHLEAGRPVLAALRSEIWAELSRLGALRGLEVEPLWRDGDIVLARLTEPVAKR